MDEWAMFTPLDICGWLWMAWALYWVISANFTLKTKKNETIARLQHTIPTFFGMVAIFHRHSVPAIDWGRWHDSAAIAWIGTVITLAGQAFAVWARIHLGKYWSGTVALKENHRLVTSGPYALVRHPIYTGLLSAVLGSALAAGTVEALAGFAVMIPAYILKWKREEWLMSLEFGAEYAAYKARTKAIIPFII